MLSTPRWGGVKSVQAIVLCLLAGEASWRISVKAEPAWRGKEALLQFNSSLPCAASGMCSIGRTKPWTGDIYPLHGLRECLAARAFRQEVILVSENRLSAGFQLVWNALEIGYDHIVLMSTKEKCQKAGRVWPQVSCIWSSQEFANSPKYMLDRHSFLPRAARLGYNVLCLDSDSMFLTDIYAYLKAPPLRDMALMALRDPAIGWLNSAIIYVQNARPDGPSVYMLAEVIDRLERWAESRDELNQRGWPSGCWEQMVMSDVLMGAVIGRPMTYGCWNRDNT
eukprot:XP_001696753.1 predicted protein [Chlamydomonas reinhardtii]